MFHEAEKQKFEDRLTLLFYIMKGIIGLNSQDIIEYLLSDEVYLDTFGVLECTFGLTVDDPDINIYLVKHKYRSFLRERVAFVNTTAINDPEILCKIHLNFRLIFLRDTASARWIEETTHELLMSVSFPAILDDQHQLRIHIEVRV